MSVERGAVAIRGVKKSFRAYHADSLKHALIRLLKREPLADRREVLRGIDLEVLPGDRLGIIGKNGAGKSTLFRLMSGILTPDEGTIEVGGRVSPLIEITAGLVPDLTGAENIRLNAAVLGLTRRQVDERFQAIVDFAELGEFLETPTRYYSSGMQARLGFSVAVHVDADVLLIDEVLAVGDLEFQDRCLARLLELSAAGKSIVVVSHDFEALRSFCRRVAWLDVGCIRTIGAPDVVLDCMVRETKQDRTDDER